MLPYLGTYDGSPESLYDLDGWKLRPALWLQYAFAQILQLLIPKGLVQRKSGAI
jgi:hypothetical protein